MIPATGTELGAGDRVLVTRLDYLGDVILSLPLVDAIRREGAVVDYLTRDPAAQLLSGDDRFERVFAQRGGVVPGVRLLQALRARRYRAVIDLYSNPRSAWLTWLTGAPFRIGGDRRGRRRLYTHPMRVPPAVRSAPAFHLYYARPLGIERAPDKPSLREGCADRASARGALEAAGVGMDEPIIVVHPGGKWQVKRWPSDRFAALVDRIVEGIDARVVLLSGPGEEAVTTAVRDGSRGSAVALPVLPIRTVAGVIARAAGLVACDGGIMHVSAALSVPTVGIFGSAEPDIWFPYEAFGPYRAAYREMECRPCHRHVCPLGHTNCLNELSVDTVYGELTEVIAEGKSRSGTRAE